MEAADLSKYRKPVFLTGTGMSAESGVPAYREKEDSGAYCIEINPEPSSARMLPSQLTVRSALRGMGL